MIDLAPPTFLAEPFTANGTITYKVEGAITVDADGFSRITETTDTISVYAKADNKINRDDYFPPGADIEGEMLRIRLLDTDVIPAAIAPLAVVQLSLNDGRQGFAKLSIKTQPALLGDSPGTAWRRFYAIFRPE